MRYVLATKHTLLQHRMLLFAFCVHLYARKHAGCLLLPALCRMLPESLYVCVAVHEML